MSKAHRPTRPEEEDISHELQEMADEAALARGGAEVLQSQAELDWWKTYKPTRQVVGRMSELEIAVAESRIVEPSITLKALSEKFKVTSGTISKMLRTEHVLAYLDRRNEEIRLAAALTRERILTNLMIEAENYGPNGTASSRVRANELLGKEMGLFTDRSEVNQRVSGEMKHTHQGAVRVYLPDNGRDPTLVEPEEPEA